MTERRPGEMRLAMQVLHTVEQAQAFSERVHQQGRRLALVPTMGSLHEGHLTLIREGRRTSDEVVVSLFVNPKQFGPGEDLSRYPKSEVEDLAKCERERVSAVFLPMVDQLYPPGYQTYVEVLDASRGLCGEKRPGHFRGVATVVAKLLALFRPQVAVFGEKDYQQLRVIEALNRDLNLGAQIVGMPIVREADGLAMSSRNAYLSSDERLRALSLTRGLQAARALARVGIRDERNLRDAVRHELIAAQVREDYVELVDARTLRPIPLLVAGQPARLLVAAFVGTTRLIDNVALEE